MNKILYLLQQQFQQQSQHQQLSPHAHVMQQQMKEHSPSPPPSNLLPSQVKAEVQLMQQQHQQFNRQQQQGVTGRLAAHVRYLSLTYKREQTICCLPTSFKQMCKYIVLCNVIIDHFTFRPAQRQQQPEQYVVYQRFYM